MNLQFCCHIVCYITLCRTVIITTVFISINIGEQYLEDTQKGPRKVETPLNCKEVANIMQTKETIGTLNKDILQDPLMMKAEVDVQYKSLKSNVETFKPAKNTTTTLRRMEIIDKANQHKNIPLVPDLCLHSKVGYQAPGHRKCWEHIHIYGKYIHNMMYSNFFCI